MALYHKKNLLYLKKIISFDPETVIATLAALTYRHPWVPVTNVSAQHLDILATSKRRLNPRPQDGALPNTP
jgi:hypothetical protein